VEAEAVIGPGATLVADVAVESGATVQDSVLWTGTAVGPSATVEGALLGPRVRVAAHARVRPGAVLGEGTVLTEHSRSA